jgi:hypothetical protein
LSIQDGAFVEGTRMLSKDICRQCCDTLEGMLGRGDYGWGDTDDDNWERGYVCCPNMIQVTGMTTVPQKCLFRLEQLMSKPNAE